MINVTKREYDFLEETKHKADVMGFDDLWCYKQIIQFVQRECNTFSQLDSEFYVFYLFKAYHEGYKYQKTYYIKAPYVDKFKKQFVDDCEDSLRYLNRRIDTDTYSFSTKVEASNYQTKFTADEIKEFKDKYSKYFNFDSWEMIPVDD